MPIGPPKDATARQKLVYFVRELERLEEEAKEAAAALRDEFKRAGMHGLDASTLKVVLKLRKLSPEQRKQRRALEAIYMASLGMLDGDSLPDEARRRLDGKKGPDDPPSAPSAAAAPAGKSADQKPDPGTGSKKAAGETPTAPARAQQTLKLKEPEEARQEGRAAAAAGKRVFDNPYPAGDPCRAAWDEGWCEASGSNGMATPDAYQRRKEKPDAKGDDSKKKPESGDKGRAA
jgi:uncharacterized protein (UPF0335 family)